MASAVLPLFLEGLPLGTLVLDFKEPHHFTAEEIRFLRTLAAQCAIALGRARLMTDLQRQVQERTKRIEQDARAHEAFMAFTESVGTETDELTLAQRAIGVLRERFADGSIGYYTREDDLWKVRVWSGDMEPALVERLTAGLPDSTPFIRRALETNTAVLTDDWDPEREQIEHSEVYGSAATYPLVMGGEVRRLLLFGLKDTASWHGQDRALVRAVGRGLTLALERAEQTEQLIQQNAELDARTRALEGFAELTRDLTLNSDPDILVQRAQQVVLSLLPPGYALYFEPQGERWVKRAQTGDVRNADLQAVADAGLPYAEAGNLLIPFTSLAPYYQDQYAQGTDNLDDLVTHLGASATFPLLVQGRAHGVFAVILFGKVRPWSGTEKAVMETVVRSLGLALERAEAVRQLEEERAALDAFVAYQQAVGSESDVLALARQAVQVAREGLDHVSAAYYELDEGMWKARVWSDDIPAEIVAQIQQGVPQDAPHYAEAARTGAGVFADGWNASANSVQYAEAYGAAAFLPLVVHGDTLSLFSVGTRNARAWTEREKALVRAVTRGLDVTLERTEITRRLQEQNEELDARTRALEGFADLTRDLSVEADKALLVKRAQEVVMSLLGEGYALYYERDGERWRNQMQVGEVGNADLQAFIDIGPLVDATPSVDVPWTTGQAVYQDRYARGSDTPKEMVEHVSTVASLPVLRRGEVVGVFIAVLFSQRTWTNTDREVLETVVRSLGLAMERAEGVVALAQRTRELERSNAELEQFAYVASHDLQEPLRTVTSFSQLLASKYAGRLDDKADLYIQLITDGTARMGQLLQDLLAFARVSSGTGTLVPVETQVMLPQVAQDLHAQIERTGASIRLGALPAVLGDASQLRQLFQNLIGNALKFSALERAPRVQVDAVRDGDLWRFSVADNGVGIAPEFFERIFTIFQRLHTRDKYEGNGIGLSITRKIVEQHGGTLWLESTPGVGTTFFFTLPAAERAR